MAMDLKAFLAGAKKKQEETGGVASAWGTPGVQGLYRFNGIIEARSRTEHDKVSLNVIDPATGAVDEKESVRPAPFVLAKQLDDAEEGETLAITYLGTVIPQGRGRNGEEKKYHNFSTAVERNGEILLLGRDEEEPEPEPEPKRRRGKSADAPAK